MPSNLATAYVQILPTTKGISGQLADELSGPAGSAGEAAGKIAGGKFGIGLKAGIAALGVGLAAVVKNAVEEGGQLEQSIGGIETLFKESADTVRDYAAVAYKTAGVGANEYMQQVTRFSASLLQSLGGDTAQAAEVANMAIIDMADNANKMGTDIQSIQNAYQGFAKQNYTMLDNLRIGYGGTKKEMERLLADAEKITGIKYDISNLNDVYQAIHVIQGELGITGTTAQEAASTIQGSFASMKAAASNFLGALAMGDDMEKPMTELIDSIETFLVGNLLPMVGRIVSALPGVIMTFIQEGLPRILDQLKEWMTSALENSEDIGKAIGKWVAQAIESLAQLIADYGPDLIELGLQIIAGIVVGLIEASPELVTALGKALGQLLKAGLELVGDFVELGAQIVGGIIQGITQKIGELFGATKDMLKGVIDSSKGYLGIESPSRVFADEVGAMIGLGVAEGIESTQKEVEKSINGLGGAALVDAQTLVSGTAQLTAGPVDNFEQNEPTIDAILQMGSAILARLNEMKLSVELDGVNVVKGLAPYSSQYSKDEGPSFVV